MKIITLKEYRKQINRKELDQYEDLPVVVGKDDEGNGYDRILYQAGSLMEDVEVNNDMGKTFKKAICLN